MPDSEIEILLIEDNRSDAEMTIRALNKNRILNKIVHLKDGKEALDFLFGNGKYAERNISQKPKFILLDLKMPKLNGLDVLQILKENEETKTIPIIVLTSSKEHPDIQKCYALGVNSYIVKPVSFADFIKTVSDLGVYWICYNQPPQ